jgi:hypothetical protein
MVRELTVSESRGNLGVASAGVNGTMEASGRRVSGGLHPAAWILAA